jgi:hypothetical protein
VHVILLGDSVLAGEPEILLSLDSILEARVCEGLDRGILVVDALEDTRALEVINCLVEQLLAVLVSEYELACTLLRNSVLCSLVEVAVSVTCNCDRLCPVLDYWLDAVDRDRSTEYCTVEDGSDSSVRALPHLMEMILVHTLSVRSDCSALYANAILLDSFAGVLCDLITSLITYRKSEVIVLCLEVYERKNKLVFDHLPEDPCHFVSVHLNDRSSHFDLFHFLSLKKL